MSEVRKLRGGCPRCIDVDTNDWHGQEAIICAIQGKLARLQSLLATDMIDLDECYTFEKVQWLETGVHDCRDWREKRNNTLTLMHVGARYGQVEILKVLVRAGAAVDATGLWAYQRYKPLAEAVKAGSLTAVETLLNAGARPGYASNDLLYRALDARPEGIFSQDRKRIYELLLARGASIEFQDLSAQSCTLEMAVRYNQIDTVRDLLDRKVPCDRALSGFVANQAADASPLELLISHGASDLKQALDPCSVDGVGLDQRWATPGGCFEKWTQDARQARRDSMKMVISYFRDSFTIAAAIEALMTAARMNDTILVALLVSRGLPTEHFDARGVTVLHSAALGYRSLETLNWLMENGADLDKQSSPHSARGQQRGGDTALHTAMAWRSDTDIAIRLLEAGADVNATNDQGETPLLALCRSTASSSFNWIEWERDLAKLHALLEAGANVNAVCNDGKNALIYQSAVDRTIGRAGTP